MLARPSICCRNYTHHGFVKPEDPAINRLFERGIAVADTEQKVAYIQASFRLAGAGAPKSAETP